MDIEELFGTLQHAVVGAWRKHLKTSKHDVHVVLNDFYEDLPDLVDKLIEDYMGVNGKVEDYENELSEKDYTAIEYLEKLREVAKNGYELMNDEPELEADLDDIVSLIDSTLYKLKELTNENRQIGLMNFLNESLE